MSHGIFYTIGAKHAWFLFHWSVERIGIFTTTQNRQGAFCHKADKKYGNGSIENA